MAPCELFKRTVHRGVCGLVLRGLMVADGFNLRSTDLERTEEPSSRGDENPARLSEARSTKVPSPEPSWHVTIRQPHMTWLKL